MGGYGKCSGVDILTSRNFIDSFQQSGKLGKGRAIDCGAGIGRITKDLLLDKFEKVDLIEPCPKYIEDAKKYVDNPNAENFYCAGLQEFEFKYKYDCIWI